MDRLTLAVKLTELAGAGGDSRLLYVASLVASHRDIVPECLQVIEDLAYGRITITAFLKP